MRVLTGPLTAIKDVLSFLRAGVSPSSTPAHLEQKMRDVNHLASKKFYIVSTSFIALCFFYFASVGILFLLPQQGELIGGYVTIFTKTIEVLAIIIASYLGVQAVVDLKYNSSSHAETVAQSPTEKVIAEETIRYQEVYKNDKSYAPLYWSMSYE